MGKKGDLNDFECGMVVGARRAGLSISQTADLLGFSSTTISRVYREWTEKEKRSSERQLCGRKCLVDVRGQKRMGRLVRDDRKSNSNSHNHSLQPRYAEYHLWTYNTSNPEADLATAAEDHTGCRSCQLRTGNEGYNWTKEDCKNCCDVQMVGSESGIKNMKAWIHPALSQRFRLVVVG